MFILAMVETLTVLALSLSYMVCLRKSKLFGTQLLKRRVDPGLNFGANRPKVMQYCRTLSRNPCSVKGHHPRTPFTVLTKTRQVFINRGSTASLNPNPPWWLLFGSFG